MQMVFGDEKKKWNCWKKNNETLGFRVISHEVNTPPLLELLDRYVFFEVVFMKETLLQINWH